MMTLIATLILLFLAVVAGIVIQKDPGYALISYGDMSIESTLAVMIAAVLLFYLLLYIATRLLSLPFQLPARLNRHKENRNRLRAHQTLRRSVSELVERRWSEAEKLSMRYLEQSEAPLVNYLVAAYAANQQQATQRRDLYMESALAEHSYAIAPLNMLLAEWHLNEGALENAAFALQKLEKVSPQHPQVKQLRVRYLSLSENWSELLSKLADAHKKGWLESDEITRLETLCWQKLSADSHNSASLRQLWSQLSSRSQQDEALLHSYVERLINLGESPVAEPLLLQHLNQHWSELLVRDYGLLTLKDTNQQLKQAESWLSQHQRSAMLLLSLARICIARQLWGKAKLYLESSIGLQKSSEAYYQYAELLKQLDEKEAALENYRLGLQLALEQQA